MVSKPKQRLSADERQEQIILAAIELAGTRGLQGVTTQAMADALGLTQGAIFRHFSSKDAVWIAAIEWLRASLTAVLAEAAQGAGNPLDALERVFHAHVAFVTRYPAIPRIVFSGGMLEENAELKNAVQAMVSGYKAWLMELIDNAKEAGLVRREIDDAAAATMFLGMIQGLVIQFIIIGRNGSMREEAGKVFPIYLAGIKTEGAA